MCGVHSDGTSPFNAFTLLVQNAVRTDLVTVVYRENLGMVPLMAASPSVVMTTITNAQLQCGSITLWLTLGKRTTRDRVRYKIDYISNVFLLLILWWSGVSYLIPGHLWLFVWSHIVLYIRTGDHFAVGYLSFLQMADFGAVAFPLITLLHCH